MGDGSGHSGETVVRSTVSRLGRCIGEVALLRVLIIKEEQKV